MVFYEAGGQQIVRLTPDKYNDRKSPAQLAQRAKVRGVADLYANLDDQLVVYWRELTRGTSMNGYNLFLSRNIANMTAEGRIADCSKIVVTQGDVEAPAWWKAEPAEPDALVIEWDTRCQHYTSHEDYAQVAVFYDAPDWSDRNLNVESLHDARRSDGRLVFRFAQDTPGNRHVYAFFRARYSNEVSESCYLGCF